MRGEARTRGKNTRELLRKTAIDLFAQKGYADTSIREIGARAGVSNSIIYHYFKSKEEMLFEIIDTATRDVIEALEDIQKRIPDPVACMREMLMHHMVHFSLKRKKETQILTANSHLLKGRRRQLCRQMQRQIYDLYRQKLRELNASGGMNDVDVTVVTFSIFGMINSFFWWHREGGRLSQGEVAHSILEFISHGILKE